jgi:hypothetical protein
MNSRDTSSATFLRSAAGVPGAGRFGEVPAGTPVSRGVDFTGSLHTRRPISVMTTVGHTTLTRTPRPPSSRARTFVAIRRAALLAQ